MTSTLAADMLRAFSAQYSVLWLAVLLPPILVSVVGDALYVGLWYYLVVPGVIVGLSACVRPDPYYLSGIAVVIAVTFLAYLSINWFSSKPEGLLGLGHLFSLPGLLLGTGALNRVDAKGAKGHWFAFLVGFSGAAGGFIVNQLLVCNSVMYCGRRLSFWL